MTHTTPMMVYVTNEGANTRLRLRTLHESVEHVLISIHKMSAVIQCPLYIRISHSVFHMFIPVLVAACPAGHNYLRLFR